MFVLAVGVFPFLFHFFVFIFMFLFCYLISFFKLNICYYVHKIIGRLIDA